MNARNELFPKPYCEAQCGGMECGKSVNSWGEQCERHDPKRKTVIK